MAHSRLDQLVTSWTIVGQMQHTLAPDDKDRLWREFLGRYENCVRRYLMAMVRSEDKVDELYSRFLQRCVTSLVPRADRTRGRFRDLVKTVLINLVRNYWEAQARPGKQHVALPEGVEPVQEQESVAAFDAGWREHLIQRAMNALSLREDRSSQRAYAVLRYKLDHEDERSPAIAEHFSKALGKPLSAEWVRKQILTARQHLGELVVREVENTLDEPTHQELEEEIVALGLLEQCRQALAERQDGGKR